ncbi:hypothetical protein BT93_H1718 [Corymbia citriodora subsp. variegata]|nr:hypothetical protein BT93_H1718 [Corymbia citriodora subsp. variegata]
MKMRMGYEGRHHHGMGNGCVDGHHGGHGPQVAGILLAHGVGGHGHHLMGFLRHGGHGHGHHLRGLFVHGHGGPFKHGHRHGHGHGHKGRHHAHGRCGRRHNCTVQQEPVQEQEQEPEAEVAAATPTPITEQLGTLALTAE